MASMCLLLTAGRQLTVQSTPPPSTFPDKHLALALTFMLVLTEQSSCYDSSGCFVWGGLAVQFLKLQPPGQGWEVGPRGSRGQRAKRWEKSCLQRRGPRCTNAHLPMSCCSHGQAQQQGRLINLNHTPEGNVSSKKWKGGLGPETRHFLFLGLSYLVCQMREEARPFLPSILYLQRKFYDLINLKGTFPDLFNVGFSTL